MGLQEVLRRTSGDTTAAELEQYAEQLAAAGLGAVPEPIHIAAVEVLEKLIGLGTQYESNDDEVPLQLRVLLRGMAQLKPMMLQWIARVPPEQMAQGLTVLRDDLDHVIGHATPAPVAAPAVDVPLPFTPEVASDDHSSTGEAGPDTAD